MSQLINRNRNEHHVLIFDVQIMTSQCRCTRSFNQSHVAVQPSAALFGDGDEPRTFTNDSCHPLKIAQLISQWRSKETCTAGKIILWIVPTTLDPLICTFGVSVFLLCLMILPTFSGIKLLIQYEYRSNSSISNRSLNTDNSTGFTRQYEIWPDSSISNRSLKR